MKTNMWQNCDEKKLKEIDLFAEDYKSFLFDSKTERECIKTFSKMLSTNGFLNLNDLIKVQTNLKTGDKVFVINMNKALVAFIVGKEPIEKGMNILCAHIDSPRLDLKSNPIYEGSGFCMFDTHYYGGIKKYQWTTLPLALHGLVCKKDGSKIDIKIGEDECDPVFGVTDLLPHLSDKEKTVDIKGEQLNLIVGGKAENGSVKTTVVKILENLGIDESDFASAEIEVVPAGKPRDFGFDKSMIMGYGHDDRSCAFAIARAIISCSAPQKTSAIILVDKEETGSLGATGMKSRFFENMVAEVMKLAGEYNELSFKRALNKSQVISCDVTAGFDPNWPDSSNKKTEAFLSRGIAFCKYTGSKGKADSNDANPEYIAKLRRIMDENDVAYQFTEMGKVDVGGGGTIAYILAEYGMEVIDAGVPVLSMHAPWEVISKFDLYENYLFYKLFLEKV